MSNKPVHRQNSTYVCERWTGTELSYQMYSQRYRSRDQCFPERNTSVSCSDMARHCRFVHVFMCACIEIGDGECFDTLNAAGVWCPLQRAWEEGESISILAEGWGEGLCMCAFGQVLCSGKLLYADANITDSWEDSGGAKTERTEIQWMREEQLHYVWVCVEVVCKYLCVQACCFNISIPLQSIFIY